MEFIERNKYKNKSGIYVITNTISGTFYIGQTRQPFIKRYYFHLHLLQHGKHDNAHLQRSFDKYGTDAFTFKVIHVVSNPDYLDGLEEWEIMLGRMRGKCCNIQDGGAGGHGFPMPEEHKKRLAALNKILNTGKKASEETKKRMSEARKGIKRKPEDMKKMVESKNKKYLAGEKNGTTKITAEEARQIKIDLMNGVKYAELAIKYNISRSNINAIRSNRSWKFVEVPGWDEFCNKIAG